MGDKDTLGEEAFGTRGDETPLGVDKNSVQDCVSKETPVQNACCNSVDENSDEGSVGKKEIVNCVDAKDRPTLVPDSSLPEVDNKMNAGVHKNVNHLRGADDKLCDSVEEMDQSVSAEVKSDPDTKEKDPPLEESADKTTPNLPDSVHSSSVQNDEDSKCNTKMEVDEPSNNSCENEGSVDSSVCKKSVNSNCSCTSCSVSTITNDDEDKFHDIHERTENSVHRGRKRRINSSRTRTPTKRKKLSVVYQSQISPDKNCIKIKIKKSPSQVQSKKHRKKEKSKKHKRRENGGTHTSRRRNNATEFGMDPRQPFEVSKTVNGTPQSGWACDLDPEILKKIFSMVAQDDGCLPFLCRAARVCKMWRNVSLDPYLWQNTDLSSRWMKGRFRTDNKLMWLCQHRLNQIQELSLGGWKVDNITSVLENITSHCPELKGISLAGWVKLTSDHLKFLLEKCTKLSQLDLSSITTESINHRSAVSLMSLCSLAKGTGSRLTQLVLAYNHLSGMSQIVSAIAENCPNLQVLDVTNIRTKAQSSVSINIEKLQKGCQKLRVLRLSNSEIVLAPSSLKEQVASPGFPMLEELSIAVDGKSYWAGMDDSSVERILKLSHKLRLLNVRGCSKISDSSLVRVPAWDLEHLFMSGCYATRLSGNGLELIAQKWSHSLIEVDLAWSSATQALDMAVNALAERGAESPLRVLNLCGSSVSFSPVKAVLSCCPQLISLNLASCRALPRGMKRLYEGVELEELRTAMEGGKFEKTEEPEEEEESHDKETSADNEK